MNFDNLVAVLAVAAAVPLILVAVPRVRVPGPVLEIVAGIVLGPAVLHLVKPDQSVRLVSTIGLAFLLFLAGLEIDVRHFRGPRGRLAELGFGLSALLALIVGIVLHAAGLVESPLLVGIILLATSLSLIMGALATHLGFEAILGAFIAGAILCLVDADAEHKHPLLTRNSMPSATASSSRSSSSPAGSHSTCRCCSRAPRPCCGCRSSCWPCADCPPSSTGSALTSIRDVAAAGLLQATSLPFIVAATTIGLQLHVIRPTNAAALVAAGLFSVILFPIISLHLLR
jgi:Kef-type K+ transport system membrane component KefB